MNYIYGLFCPVALTIRYVGKSNDPERRLSHHLTCCKKAGHHAGRWLASLRRRNLRPDLIILAEVAEGYDWGAEERKFIESGPRFGWRLTNSTPGGEGGGFIRDEDKDAWIQKVTLSLRSEEVRARISEGVRAAYADPIVRDKAVARMRARWADPDYRERTASNISSRMKSAESRANMAKHGKARMSDPGAKAAVASKLSAYYATDEGRENKRRTSRATAKVEASRNGQLENWQDPSYRLRIMSAKTAPDVIQKQKDKARGQWADPQVRARMIAAIKAAAERRKQEKTQQTSPR